MRELTRLELRLEGRAVLVLELDPDPAPELDLVAPLPRVLLVLDDGRQPGGRQHVADLQVGGVHHAVLLGDVAALGARLGRVQVRWVNAYPPGSAIRCSIVPFLVAKVSSSYND